MSLPRGPWELLNMSTHTVSCVGVNLGVHNCHCASQDCNTTALQTRSKT